jgi:hypothetical protein
MRSHLHRPGMLASRICTRARTCTSAHTCTCTPARTTPASASTIAFPPQQHHARHSQAQMRSSRIARKYLCTQRSPRRTTQRSTPAHLPVPALAPTPSRPQPLHSHPHCIGTLAPSSPCPRQRSSWHCGLASAARHSRCPRGPPR